MNRPPLNEIPIPDMTKDKFVAYDATKVWEVYVTMGEGQWDRFLEHAYNNRGVLLEVKGDDEVITKAYKKETTK